jgi:hypothetical protein
MKKSVLFALLGVTSVEGLRINQREAQTAAVEANAEEAPANGSNSSLAEPTPVNGSTQALAVNGTNGSAAAFIQNASNGTAALIQNASNATAALIQNASNGTAAFHQGDNGSNGTAAFQYDFVKALVDIDDKQQDMDHEAEMAQVDKEAEEQVKKQHNNSDSEEENLAIEADIQDDDAKDCKIEPKKNKDSSDDECACAPHKLTEKDKSKIKAKQAKKTADAKAAKAAADKAREAAEEAIAAANLAKRTSAKNVLELAKKAEEAIAEATSAEHKKIVKQSEAKQKVAVVKSEKYDLRVKLAVKNWEETVVNKHELWETYKSIKKNFRIAVTNVKLVRQNVKAAENKLIQVRKTSALNPKDIGAREKIHEAQTLVSVLRKQLLDAENQKVKIAEQRDASQAKAREASVASAKAKAFAEKHFRSMVIENNKTCSACRLGKEKIAKRRLEIDGAIKQEVKLKAQREAEKRRQSRGRGGQRAGATARAGLAQETAPAAAPTTN